MIDMTRASTQTGSMTKRNARTKSKTSVPSKQWKKLNEVREDESSITWNAFSPPQRCRTGNDLSSQSSQSQGAGSTIDTSPSVFFGAKIPVSNASATTPVLRPRRTQNFMNHRSREDLINQIKQMGRKPAKKCKSGGSYESSENTEITEPNSTSPTTSGDFPDDGLDDEINEMFESSQAVITNIQRTSRPSPPKIPETPKRATTSRVGTRSMNLNNSVIVPTSSSTTRLIQPTNNHDSTTDTINEQLLRLNTGTADYNDSFMNDEDDDLFSQLPY